MEYFDIFELSPGFLLEEADLKRRFYANSKRYHPDFHTQADEATQQEILLKSSLNNKAYKTLKTEYSRIGYVLQQLGLTGEGVKHDLPQDFLMEMMEVNESMMELQMDPDPTQLEAAKAKVNQEISALRSGVLADLGADPLAPGASPALNNIKDYYLKVKYLLRMLENLDRFAGASGDVDPFA